MMCSRLNFHKPLYGIPDAMDKLAHPLTKPSESYSVEILSVTKEIHTAFVFQLLLLQLNSLQCEKFVMADSKIAPSKT